MKFFRLNGFTMEDTFAMVFSKREKMYHWNNFWDIYIYIHSSEIRVLGSTFCPRKTLQSYVYGKRKPM